ncbi:hypothetical protein J4461_00405 [Candidatus Pacearchaeota archaeon]|nr:hypothetical protein [Candidatus Pacearchaeota archaeon]
MTRRILNRIPDCLDDLTSKLFPHPEMSKGEVVCNVSPFTSQYNTIAIKYAKMRREGATSEQIRNYTLTHPITTTEGQWKAPCRFPTYEEHLEINAQILKRKHA